MNNKIKLLYLGFHLNAIMLIIFNFSSEELVSLDVWFNGLILSFQPVSLTNRETMARIKNCITALVSTKVMLDDSSIMFAYEESLKYETVKELLDPEAMFDIAFLAQHRINDILGRWTVMVSFFPISNPSTSGVDNSKTIVDFDETWNILNSWPGIT